MMESPGEQRTPEQIIAELRRELALRNGMINQHRGRMRERDLLIAILIRKFGAPHDRGRVVVRLTDRDMTEPRSAIIERWDDPDSGSTCYGVIV